MEALEEFGVRRSARLDVGLVVVGGFGGNCCEGAGALGSEESCGVRTLENVSQLSFIIANLDSLTLMAVLPLFRSPALMVAVYHSGESSPDENYLGGCDVGSGAH